MHARILVNNNCPNWIGFKLLISLGTNARKGPAKKTTYTCRRNLVRKEQSSLIRDIVSLSPSDCN